MARAHVERRLLVVAALAGAAPTCERALPVRSADVATRDTQLHLTIEGDAASTRWLAWLLGPGAPVLLDDADRLLVDGAPMHAAGEGAYAIERPAADERGTLRFERDDLGEDAEVVIELPPRTPLAVPAAVPPGEPLVVRWDPSPGAWATFVRVEGPCLAAVEQRLDVDEGAATFDAEVIEVDAGCAVVVRLTRLLARDLAAAPFERAPSRILRWSEAISRVGR